MKCGSIESFLYSVGLSLATIMFTGFFINIIYPLFGIKDPISFFYLIATISFLVLFLSVLSFVRDRSFSAPNLLDTKNFMSNQFLFLSTLPFLSILGIYLMNNYQINLILILLILFIGLTALLVTFDKIPKILYPFTVFIISISILFHTSLISNYIWGWDINTEYYTANVVLQNHFWNYLLGSGNTNSMLSITMLAPIYSLILNIDLVSILKVIYPFFLSLVPLGLYSVFKKQTTNKIAFLACFFFISFFTFYFEMPQLAKQEIAELFFVLIIMLLVDKQNKFDKSVLLIIFTFSLIVSHYGLSYIFMLMLVLAFLILYITRIIKSKIKKEKSINSNNSSNKYKITRFTFILFFIVFLFAWYSYVSSSAPFVDILSIINQITSSIFTEFLNPATSQGLALIQTTNNSVLHTMGKYIQLATQFLIIVGILGVATKKIKFNIDNEFLIFGFVSLIILILGILLPFFASSLNTSRLYEISLFFLAPFCVIGFIFLFNIMNKIFKTHWTDKTALKLMSIFLIIFLLFNTGLLYHIFNDGPTSLSLDNLPSFPEFNDQEVQGVKWLTTYKTAGYSYGDARFASLLEGYSGNSPGEISNDLYYPKGSYISLGTYNILSNQILVDTNGTTNYTELNDNILGNEIYDNGGFRSYRI